MLLINELKLGLNEQESKLKELISKRLHAKDNTFTYEIYKKSLDSRKDINFTYQVLVSIDHEDKYLSHKGVSKYKKQDLRAHRVISDERPIIIGYGPSGIFAACRFVEAGLKPIIIEKGKRVKDREIDVDKFFNEGVLNPKSNVQFGEGGAGTFSDAKLVTRIKNPYIEYILDTFINNGAKKEIKYTAHAHIGTDEMRRVIEKITNSLSSQGAEFHFEEEVKDFVIENGKLTKVITDKNEYSSNYFLLGIGHSSCPTVKALLDKGVFIEQADTAVGFRVEHPQSLIDNNQYHGIKSDKLEASEYFLRYTGDKSVFSFCMCPGGLVIPATSEEHRTLTNGMSYSSRDSGYANSAILVQVNKEEYKDYPLAGFDYLKELEEKAYNVSNSYKALASNIKDYIYKEDNPLIFNPSYSLGTVKYNFNNFFNEEQNKYFKEALLDFDKKIPGFIDKGIMIGPETRFSSPVRIKRNEYYESVNTKGLFPMGEGSGYGGGIMSCSLDGIKVANSILDTIK
ncbi:MAG: hypothetical protein Q4F12_00215 [Erysipelotrichaceae bacterium]|nr:hypothetical protein [Erysipelotrichaceae bacterium]